MMENIRKQFLKNAKMLMLICITLTCLLYMYCSPINNNEIFSILRGSLIYIGFSIFMYFSVCINCFTGAYEFFKVPYIKYSVFIMLGSIFAFVVIFGFISTIMTRRLDVFSFSIPALIGAYIGCKSVDYIDKRSQDN